MYGRLAMTSTKSQVAWCVAWLGYNGHRYRWRCDNDKWHGMMHTKDLSHGIGKRCLNWPISWYILLEVNRTRDENAQARTHTQRHMNNAWSEIASCSLCFAIYCFSSFPWFIQTIWDNSYPSQTNVVALFLPYRFSCLFHYVFIDYEQSNALPSTIPSSITFILATSNLMLHLQHVLGH